MTATDEANVASTSSTGIILLLFIQLALYGLTFKFSLSAK